jgi:hypothetical protein
LERRPARRRLHAIADPMTDAPDHGLDHELDDALMDALCDAVLGVPAATAEQALAALCVAHPTAAHALRRRAASMLAAERALQPQFPLEPDPTTIGDSRVVRRHGRGGVGGAGRWRSRCCGPAPATATRWCASPANGRRWRA